MNVSIESFDYGAISTGSGTYGQNLNGSSYDNNYYRTNFIEYYGNAENVDIEVVIDDTYDLSKRIDIKVFFLFKDNGGYSAWQSVNETTNINTKCDQETRIYTKTINISTYNSSNYDKYLEYIRIAIYYADTSFPSCPAKLVKIVSKAYWYMTKLTPRPVDTKIPSDDTMITPYPNCLWQIDGVHNNGYPFISLMQNLPYTSIIPKQEVINFLDKVRVRSIPHGIDQDFIVSKITIQLGKPDETKYSLGKKVATTFTGSSNAINADIASKIKEVPKVSTILKSAKENAASLINSATNGYVTMVQEDGHTSEIVISNEPDYKKAQQIWRWNQNGLAHSSSGYDAEEYDNAILMDGSIVADRITAGTMQADRIRGGTLLLGGFEYADGKNGVLSLISGKDDKDMHETVRLDKDGAYIEGTTVSANTETGYTMVLDDGHIYSYQNYNRDKPFGEPGESPEFNKMVSYIHMTNGISGEGLQYDYGLGFYSTGPIIFNSPEIWVGHDFNSIIGVPKMGKKKVITNVELKKNGDDYYLETKEEELLFLNGFCINAEGEWSLS